MNQEPKDGDFARLLSELTQPELENRATVGAKAIAAEPGTEDRQTIEDILTKGELPTDEFIEEWREFESAPAPSEEELARLALSDPGADGDVNTPE